MERSAQAMEKLHLGLEEYRKQGKYNVLVPTLTIQEISPFHKAVLEIVTINPDPKQGEVYEPVLGSGDFAMKAVALQKIGYAAGLIWNAKGCGRTDDGSKPTIVSYRAEAAVRKEDGTYMLLNAEYMVDLEVIEEETRQSYEKKSQDLAKEKRWSEQQRKDYIEKSLRRDMLQKRKFRLQLAQTGAMDRVIRKILGLKGTYKREELSKPFVVPRIAFNPDVSDPKVRELLLRQGLDATSMLFGASSEKGMIDYQPVTEHERVIDTETVPGDDGGDVHDEPSKGSSEGKPSEKPNGKSVDAPFEKMNANDQIDCLKTLMKKKAYGGALKKALDAFTESERAAFYSRLISMSDADELPFD